MSTPLATWLGNAAYYSIESTSCKQAALVSGRRSCQSSGGERPTMSLVLTGYSHVALNKQIEEQSDFEPFLLKRRFPSE
jgi:hypothetical protein